MTRSAQRWTALWVALLWVSVQGGSLVHSVTEEHRICAEHGELLHGEAPDAAEASERSAVGARAGTESDDHAHCEILLAGDELPAERLDTGAALSPEVDPAVPASAATPASVLSYAPKQSPPAV